MPYVERSPGLMEGSFGVSRWDSRYPSYEDGFHPHHWSRRDSKIPAGSSSDFNNPCSCEAIPWGGIHMCTCESSLCFSSGLVPPPVEHFCPQCWRTLMLFPGMSSSISNHLICHGTLAEWLTRCPAKAIPSGACVRITQVSINRFFCFFWLPVNMT